jgi:1-phosphofructokinase family hexose kinase
MTARAAARLLFVAANPSIDRLYEVDSLAIGSIHRPLAEVAVPGGKGLNAARAAATLGGSVTVVGIVGGRAGEWIVDELATLGIEARMARGTGETRTCVSILDRTAGRLTEVYPRGPQVESATWAAFESVERMELARGVAVVALSGSLPPGAPSDGYARIARMAADQVPPVPVLADTAGDALAAVLEERPALVKVNAGEAAEATNIAVKDASSAADAATALRRAGAGVAIVTLGARGAVVVTETERFRLEPPQATGRYPTGSGDAFLGGLAVAWPKGEPIVESARLGMAAGIANAQLPGAGNLDPGRIEDLLAAITLDAV